MAKFDRKSLFEFITDEARTRDDLMKIAKKVEAIIPHKANTFTVRINVLKKIAELSDEDLAAKFGFKKEPEVVIRARRSAPPETREPAEDPLLQQLLEDNQRFKQELLEIFAQKWDELRKSSEAAQTIIPKEPVEEEDQGDWHEEFDHNESDPFSKLKKNWKLVLIPLLVLLDLGLLLGFIVSMINQSFLAGFLMFVFFCVGAFATFLAIFWKGTNR